MKIFRLRRIIFLLIVLFAVGCTVNPIKPTPAKTKPHGFYGPENQYYYFTAAQVQRKKGNLDTAVVLLKKAIELDPDSSYLQRELVTVYLQNKEHDKAIEVLEGMLQKNPKDLKSLIIYGGIKQVRKETDDAVAIYEKILAIDPKQQRIYSLLGGLYMEAGDFERAAEVFNRELENFPGSYTGHFYLGRTYAKQGKLKDAETEFRKALELKPDRSEARFELIDIYKTRGKTKKVIGQYEEILRSNPGNVRASMELGYYYQQQGMKKEAQKYLIKLGLRSQNEFEVIINVIQLYIDPKKFDEALIVINGMLKGVPDNPDIHHLAGISYYGIKNNDMALFHFLKVTQESRFFQDAVVHVAFIYQDQQKNEKAIKFLSSAMAKDPENPDFKYYLGTFYEETEDYEKAVDNIKQAIELEPDNLRYYFRLGVVYDKWNKKEASIETMQKVIALDPKHANALNYLGYTYADLGRNLDEAERLIKEALKYKPNDGYITDSLGWVYYKKGQFDKALKYIKKAVDLIPDDPIMLEHMGDVYQKLNDKPKALKFYQKSLKIKEKDKEALEEKIRQLKTTGS
jgi:tetratricopeptide (TPR) repeat protein